MPHSELYENSDNPEASLSEPHQPVRVNTNRFSLETEISELEVSHAKTRKGLTWFVLSIVLLVFLLHWGSVMYLAHKRPDSLEALGRVFDMWVPIFTGLLGSAAAVYFSDRRR